MADIRSKHELLRDECQRRADAAWQTHLRKDISETERQDALDQYHLLVVAERNHFLTVTAAADVYPVKFTGKATGERKATSEKRAFLLEVAEEFGTRKHAAIAVQAVEKHPSRVRKLWRAEGKSAESKILNFIKNNGL
jgi:hypothetical protein